MKPINPAIIYASILLLSIVFITSCNGQRKSGLAENKDAKPKPMPIQIASIERTSPKVDSILKFNSMITAIFEDSKGNFWFGSHCDGLCRYSPLADKTGRLAYTYFTVKEGLPDVRILEFDGRRVAMGNSIRSIQEDKHGNIWIGTGDGISKFDGQSFTTIQPEEDSLLINDAFEYNHKSATKAAEYLWFGEGESNGVYRYDGHQLIHFVYPVREADKHKRRSTYATYSLYKDNDGHIWFGTEQAGIMYYNGQSFNCINEHDEKGIVRSFFQDNTGKVWIANNVIGLYYYTKSNAENKTGSFINFTEEQGLYSFGYVRNNIVDKDVETLDGVQAIEQDSDGNLWFGTFSEGLWRYDGKELSHLTTENGLPDNTVKSIYKDKKGQLWFGIGRGTVYSFNGSTFEEFRGIKTD